MAVTLSLTPTQKRLLVASLNEAALSGSFRFNTDYGRINAHSLAKEIEGSDIIVFCEEEPNDE